MLDKRLCEFLLLAEFDIDVGSTIKYQYPCTTGADESHLADLMLPDRAHNHPTDWTFFLLNHDNKQLSEQDYHPKVLTAFVYEFQNKEWILRGNVDQNGETPPMSIVLYPNEIRCLQPDKTVFHTLIYSPELKFKIMKPKFCCVISGKSAYGFSFEDVLSEESFLQHCKYIQNNNNYFIKPKEPKSTDEEPGTLLYVLNHVKCKDDQTAKRGSVVKALALVSPYPYIYAFKPLLVNALEHYYEVQKREVLDEVWDIINSIDNFPRYSLREKQFYRSVEKDYEKNYFYHMIEYNGAAMPIRLPVCNFPGEFENVSVKSLISMFKEDTMKLYNALLLEQRIIFVSLDKPANEVCDSVISLVQLICPPCPGIMQRVYSYSNLTVASKMIDECKNGYIVGVKNPIFESNTQWWDVIANLDTGLVTINPKLAAQETITAIDKEFFAGINQKILRQTSESLIRFEFCQYTQKFIDCTLDVGEFAEEEEKKKYIDINTRRIEMFRKTTLFKNLLMDNEKQRKDSTLHSLDIERHLNKLRKRKDLPLNLIQSIYHDFLQCVNEKSTPEQLQEFLYFCNKVPDGLYSIAVLLLHNAPLVRENTVKILDRLQKIEEGQVAVKKMNPFLLITYERLRASIQ